MCTFAGGCVTYQFSFVTGAAPSLAIPIDTAIGFEPPGGQPWCGVVPAAGI
jgi:hypothetical protein